jgi:hypothetical protein
MADGFNVDFYQKKWLVKNDLFVLVQDFHAGVLYISSLSYGA